MNSAQWKRTRAQKLSNQPFCEECAKQGIVTAAQCVHHLKPIESAPPGQMAELAYAMGNLESLCYECHHKIHADMRSHSRDVHKQRNQSRLQQWIANHTNNKQ